MNECDSPFSRLVCWAAFLLLIFLLTGRGVTRASIDPEFDRKLFFEATVSTSSVEETEVLIAAKLRVHLMNSGLFSDVTSLSMAGRLVLRGGIEVNQKNRLLSESVEQMLLPIIAPYTDTSTLSLRITPEATSTPMAYLVYTPWKSDTPVEASQRVVSLLEKGETSLTGAGRGRIFGKAEIIIHIILDPLRCAAYGVSLPEVHGLLSSWLGCGTYCGTIQGDERSLPVFIRSGIETEKQLALLPLPAGDGTAIALKELADISGELRYDSDRVVSHDGKRYIISSITPLSSGDVDSWFKVNRNPAFFREPVSMELFPAPLLRSRIDSLKILPFSLIPLILLLLYGKKREMAGAIAGELLFFIAVISLRGVLTPALILHLSLLLPSGAAAAFFMSSGKPLFSVFLPLFSSLAACFAFPPLPSCGALHVLASAATVLAGAVAVRFKTDGAIYYGMYLFLSCGVLLFFACLNAPPFLSVMTAPKWDIAFYPPESEKEKISSGSFSLLGKEHYYPGTANCYHLLKKRSGEKRKNPFPF